MRLGLGNMKSTRHETKVVEFVNHRITLPIAPYPRKLDAKVVPMKGSRCLTCKKPHRQVAKVHPTQKTRKFQSNCKKMIKHQWHQPPLTAPLRVFCVFYLERPKTVPKAKRPHPILTPDIDNLVKNIFDALTKSGVWEDDCQVVALTAQKKYCEGIETPRIEVIIEEIHENPQLPLRSVPRNKTRS